MADEPDLRPTCRSCDARATAATPPLGEMLHRYLLDQARRQFEARRKAIAAIKTPEDIARRQKELRAFFLRSLGDLPERTPLNPRVVGTLQRDGYRVEKVIFESRPEPPRHGESLPARRQAAVSGRALAVRPQRQRQGVRELSAGVHPAGQERHGRALLRPDRPGRAIPAARRQGQAGDPRHDRAHHGRDRRAPGRPAAGDLPRSGTASGHSTTWRAGPRSIPAGWAARATRAAAR